MSDIQTLLEPGFSPTATTRSTHFVVTSKHTSTCSSLCSSSSHTNNLSSTTTTTTITRAPALATLSSTTSGIYDSIDNCSDSNSQKEATGNIHSTSNSSISLESSLLPSPSKPIHASSSSCLLNILTKKTYELTSLYSNVALPKLKPNDSIWEKAVEQNLIPSSPPPSPLQGGDGNMKHVAIFLTGPPGSGKSTQMNLLSKSAKSVGGLDLYIMFGKKLKKEAVKYLSSAYDVEQFEKKHSGEDPKTDVKSLEYMQQKSFRTTMILKQKLYEAELRQREMHQNHIGHASSAPPTPLFYIYSRGPASKEQAKFMNDHLGIRPSVYIVFKLNDQKKLIERVTSRVGDPVEDVWYSLNDLNSKSGDDPVPSKRLQTRKGDTALNYPKRMKKYLSRTAVVLNYYEKELGIKVREINADQSKEDVLRDVLKVVNPILKQNNLPTM